MPSRARHLVLKVMLVDPSLYTAPYDAGLTAGLLAAGVQPRWMTRPVRLGEPQAIPPGRSDAFFYKRAETVRVPPVLRRIVKGCAHVAGIGVLLRKILRERPDVVHLQWVVVPLIDLPAMALIRRWCPLVLTVHDSVAYNGQKMSWLQRLGHELPALLAHHVIVHTRSGRQQLLRRGVPQERVSVIPHGPLHLPRAAAAPGARDPRWTMVLFGEIKPYKGLDILVDAVAALAPSVRRQLRVVVAGRPRMDVAPLAARIAQLGIEAQFELRLRRLSDDEMAALFAEADGFLFPYRQIDASGVYCLVRPLGKWLIASRIGIFAEDMADGAQGTLVQPGDVPGLARALRHAVETRPQGSVARPETSWVDIGHATRALYERTMAEFSR